MIKISSDKMLSSLMWTCHDIIKSSNSPDPALSISAIIFFSSSVLGSNPKALMTTCNIYKKKAYVNLT